MTSLRFYTSYRTILRNAVLSGIVPLDEKDFTSSKYYYICYDILVTLFVLWKLTCAIMANFTNTFGDMMMSQCITMVTITGVVVCLFYAIRRKSIITLITNADLLSRNVQRSSLGKELYFRQMYKEDARLLSYLSNVMCACSSICPLMYCISVPLSAYLQGRPITVLPVPASCSFELQVEGFYGIFVFFQFLGLTIPALQKLGNEFMMFSLFKIQSAYFKYLSESMGEIEKYIISGAKLESNNKLICWIKLHQSAIGNIQQLRKVFSPIIVAYYLCLITSVASGFFYQLNAENANVFQGSAVGIYMIVTVVQFYLLCHLAEELATEAERISAAVYRISWHMLTKKNIWYIGMTINMSNKPVRMTAYSVPSFVVNREAFLTFMVNLVSAYMGFSRIQEM